MIRKVEGMMIRTAFRLNALKDKVLYDENGDTNFISIVIVLGIVLALVVVFKGYISDIIEQIDTSVDGFEAGI